MNSDEVWSVVEVAGKRSAASADYLIGCFQFQPEQHSLIVTRPKVSSYTVRRAGLWRSDGSIMGGNGHFLADNASGRTEMPRCRAASGSRFGGAVAPAFAASSQQFEHVHTDICSYIES